MLTFFNPRAGLKALLIQCCAVAAAVASASPLSRERARDPAVLQNAERRIGGITASR